MPVMAMDSPVMCNVLNLTPQQMQAKAEIDARYEYELESSGNNVKTINRQYDKEISKLLTRQQKTKLRAVKNLPEYNVKFKQDPNLRPFGVAP